MLLAGDSGMEAFLGVQKGMVAFVEGHDGRRLVEMGGRGSMTWRELQALDLGRRERTDGGEWIVESFRLKQVIWT
jgi:hypothetical protein